MVIKAARPARTYRRARSLEHKGERRRVILSAASKLFAGGAGFPELTVSNVARRVGLAKGTVFLYFPTKEALFLGLLEEVLAEWFSAVNATLLDVGQLNAQGFA